MPFLLPAFSFALPLLWINERHMFIHISQLFIFISFYALGVFSFYVFQWNFSDGSSYFLLVVHHLGLTHWTWRSARSWSEGFDSECYNNTVCSGIVHQSFLFRLSFSLILIASAASIQFALASFWKLFGSFGVFFVPLIALGFGFCILYIFRLSDHGSWLLCLVGKVLRLWCGHFACFILFFFRNKFPLHHDNW
jgi:hypothetical protein